MKKLFYILLLCSVAAQATNDADALRSQEALSQLRTQLRIECFSLHCVELQKNCKKKEPEERNKCIDFAFVNLKRCLALKEQLYKKILAFPQENTNNLVDDAIKHHLTLTKEPQNEDLWSKPFMQRHLELHLRLLDKRDKVNTKCLTQWDDLIRDCKTYANSEDRKECIINATKLFEKCDIDHKDVMAQEIERINNARNETN